MRRAMLAAAIAAFAIAGATSGASAQEGWFFDGAAGVALPVAGLGDYLKAGPTFGVGVGQQFENVNVGLSFDVDLLSGKEFDGEEGVGANFYRYQIFGEYGFIDPRSSGSRINLLIGVGAATISTDRSPDTQERLTDTYISFESGLHAGTGRVFAELFWVGMFGTRGIAKVFPQDLASMSNITIRGGVRIG